MKMKMTSEEVAQLRAENMTGRDRVMAAFAVGKAKKESAFSTDGRSVYSYGMEIARRQKNGKVIYLLPSRSGGAFISVTTSIHMGSCEDYCRTLPDSRPVKKLPERR
jgi:hypothetical protein